MTATRFLAVLLAFAAAAGPAALAERSERGSLRALQGPMLGPVEADSAVVWVRVSDQVPVAIEYASNPRFEGARTTPAIVADNATDRIVVHRIEGLTPDTEYHYRMLIGGEFDKYQGKRGFVFRTAPALGARGVVRFAFGSCARTQADPVQAIWKVVEAKQPHLFAWVGDNIYGDSLEPGTLAEEYRYQRMVPALQPVLRSVPQLAVWDDHDFGLNDHDAEHPRKAEALEVMRQYWPNPAYGTQEAPGCYFKYAYGGVDFFFLDGRYYRDPNNAPDTAEKTLLGAEQRAWLEAGLKASSAPFKLLVCGSGWTKSKGPGGDAWSAFLHERDALFGFIRDERIEGVVLLSGDTHYGECNAVDRSAQGGYDLYDLVSSPLAQSAGTDWRQRKPEVRMRPGFSKPNFGLIEIDTAAAPPTLSFNLYGEDGQPAWAEPLVLTADDLKNGVESWRRLKRYDER